MIYFLSTRVDLIFAVNKLAKFSSNTGKVHFGGLVHLLIYIRYNENLGLSYYAEMNDAPISDLLIQASINTENQLMVFSDSSCKDFPETSRSTGSYIISYQGRKIYHGTHVSGSVSQSSAEIGYNAECTAGIYLANFRVLIHDILNKAPDIVPEEDLLIILDRVSSICMADNGKDINHTRHISRRVHFVRNGEK